MLNEIEQLEELTASKGLVQNLNKTITVVNSRPLDQRSPNYQFLKERSVHREILEYIAKGYTDKEIAGITGFTAPTIGNVRKHPMYQDDLLREIKRKANEDQEVVEFIKSKVVTAVKRIATVMESETATPMQVIAAAEALLNRRYGKPNQPVNAGNSVDLNNLPDSELARMFPTTVGTEGLATLTAQGSEQPKS